MELDLGHQEDVRQAPKGTVEELEFGPDRQEDVRQNPKEVIVNSEADLDR